jgi:hypothetical protein
MRYPLAIAAPWQRVFALFGFAAESAYVERDEEALHLHFGTAHERIPLAEVAGVARRRWPRYFGLGAKFGPDGGVAYVGSAAGVVRIDLARPRPLNVWGPFRASQARCAIVSLADADGFFADVRGWLSGHAGGADEMR